MHLRLLCVVLTVLLVPASAMASDHVASIFGGYSALFASVEHGVHGSLEVSWPTTSRIHNYLGILVDGTVNGGTDSDGAGDSVTKTTLMGGLRGLYRLQNKPIVLFAHFLTGVHRSQIGADVDNGWAGGAGGGFDVLLGSTAHGGWSFRNQYDWLHVAGESSLRLSAGIAYRFK